MKVLNVKQGSSDWLSVRGKYFCASEAPVMMGASSRASRSDLLRMKATGDEKDHSRWVREVLFERGHEVEAKARPIAEKIIGEELYPATAIDGDEIYLASFDGVTLLEDVIWECKQFNQEKAATVLRGYIPDEDKWQIVHQLVVSRAEKCLYMVTDGTKENTVSTWFTLSVEDEDALHRGWKQFAIDLDAYEPRQDPSQPVGRTPETLPALRIEVQGMVTASNLAEFREHALSVIHSVNTDLQTDQHFADAEQCVKFFKTVEDRLDAAKQHALSQTESIDELFRTIDGIKEEARAKRLELDRLVKHRKQAIRDEILRDGERAFDSHLQKLESGLDVSLKLKAGVSAPDFAGVMKGKKTVKSLRDSVDSELARAKIEASSVAEKVRANLSILANAAQDKAFLFRDLQQLAFKDQEDMKAIVKARIAEHEESEQRRINAERERIRQEEQQKLEAEQGRKSQAEKTSDVAPVPDHKPAVRSPHVTHAASSSLVEAIRRWQKNHGVSDTVMADLMRILNTYGVAEAA